MYRYFHGTLLWTRDELEGLRWPVAQSAGAFSEDYTEPKMDKGQWNVYSIHTMEEFWTRKNSTAEPGIETSTSWSLGKDVTTEPSGQAKVKYDKPVYLVWNTNIPLLEKYPTLFFCENLVDFSEAHLHEATLNLHTHAWIFYRLSVTSVDGKQHLREIVFSALVRFSLLEKYPTFGLKKNRHTWSVRNLITFKVWFSPKKI